MAEPASLLVRRHLVAGWLFLFVFLLLGAALEAFHGFKVDWYVNVGYATRRLMLTLAHAHGVLVGLIHLGFALTVHVRPPRTTAPELASICLLAGGALLPGGFLLGGLVIHQGDPGLGIFLTPVGALALGVALVLMLRHALSAPPPDAAR